MDYNNKKASKLDLNEAELTQVMECKIRCYDDNL